MIRVTRDEIDFVLAEFKIKLDRHLRTLDTFAYADVSCFKVKVKADDLLCDSVIKEIEEKFLLELNEYEVLHLSDGGIVEVWYYFNYEK